MSNFTTLQEYAVHSIVNVLKIFKIVFFFLNLTLFTIGFRNLTVQLKIEESNAIYMVILFGKAEQQKTLSQKVCNFTIEIACKNSGRN